MARKNILPLAGKSLLQWAVEAAEQAELFDRIVVSTEDSEIAQAARALGPYVPFVRPTELAEDMVDVDCVVLDVLSELEARGEVYDTVCILLATSPLRTAEDITLAYDLFDSREEPNLISVTAFEHCPFWAQGLTPTGQLVPHFPRLYDTKRQELPDAFRPNGAIHILNVAWFKKVKSYTSPPIIGFVMPRERSIDIDSIGDLVEAELMLTRGAK